MNMTRIAISLAALIAIAAPAHAVGFSATAVANTNWKTQFNGAVHWSTLGVHADSGVTADNLNALNTLPVGADSDHRIPIIGDCPGGGYIQVSANWLWQNNLTVWQQPGCVIKSTNTDPNQTVIASPLNLTDASPVTGVKYYGLQIDCLTPTQAARAVRLWLNHSDIQWSIITRCGGQTGRFGDSYFAFNHWDTYPNKIAGNPGLRELGVDVVPLAQGMPKSMWFRYGYIQSGDIGLQGCQPANAITGWNGSASTDGLLYQNSYVHASTMLIANLQDDTGLIGPYHCHDMIWDNIVGDSTYLGFVVPGIAGLSSNDGVYIYNVTQNKIKGGGHAAFGIGSVGIGGHKQYIGTILDHVIVNHAIVESSVGKSGDTSGLDIEGCMTGSIIVKNSSFDAVNTSQAPDPAIELTGCNVTLSNNIAIAAPQADAIRVGASNLANGPILTGNIATGVSDGQSGYNLVQTQEVIVTGGSVSPVARATTAIGVSLATDPSGAHTTSVHGVNLSAMPIPVVCAPGQSNSVNGNPGAANCPP